MKIDDRLLELDIHGKASLHWQFSIAKAHLNDVLFLIEASTT